MLVAIKGIHDCGIAHRDLSEVNIMINENDFDEIEDGSSLPWLYIIDFGKAVFCSPANVRKWWINDQINDISGEVATMEEIDETISALPWVKGKPDHGYKIYR